MNLFKKSAKFFKCILMKFTVLVCILSMGNIFGKVLKQLESELYITEID